MDIKRRHDFGDLMTVDEFTQNVKCGGLTDDDGSCYPIINKKEVNKACSVNNIPDEATHVVWYNK